MDELCQSWEREGSGRFALLIKPSVARCDVLYLACLAAFGGSRRLANRLLFQKEGTAGSRRRVQR